MNSMHSNEHERLIRICIKIDILRQKSGTEESNRSSQ
jgi:hypothetical protein